MNPIARNTLLLLLSCCPLVGCATTTSGAPNDSAWSGVIDQEDPRTAGGRAVLEAYQANDPEAVAAWFAEDAEIGFNKETKDKSTFVADISKDHEYFEDISLENSIVTTMRYNNGMVFTNLWTRWTGKLRQTGEEIEVPVYMFMTWNDDKIQSFMHLFDPAPFVTALESIGVAPY